LLPCSGCEWRLVKPQRRLSGRNAEKRRLSGRNAEKRRRSTSVQGGLIG